MSMTTEHRMVAAANFRVSGRSDSRTLTGYAARFDVPSLELGGFCEVIRKGAFINTLREADTRALWNHDHTFVLGRKSAGTLQLQEDAKGLAVRIIPPKTSWARDFMESIDRGDVSQMSMGFLIIKDAWHSDRVHGLPTRELLEVRLIEVSPVTFPAYPQTEVHIEIAGQTREIERPQWLIDLRRRKLHLLELIA